MPSNGDRPGRLRSPSCWAMLLVLALIVACSSAPESDVDADIGGAYAEVVRWFVDRSSRVDSDPPVVFVDALGEGFEIDLGLQATVVSSSEEFAQVRFIDDRSEAFGDDDAVRDDGILLAVGPAVIDGRAVSITSDEVDGPESAESWTFEVRRDGEGRWSLAGPPTTVEF